MMVDAVVTEVGGQIEREKIESSYRYIMDITTTISYAGRPAVGIVRVEREIVKAFLRNYAAVSFVTYSPEDDEFKSVALADVFALTSDLPDGVALRTSAVDRAGLFDWRNDDVLVSAGLVWDHNFMRLAYEVKKATGIRFAQIVYDIIPITMPEYSVPGMISKFPRFILDTLWTADVIFGISNYTNLTLSQYAERIGKECPRLERIALGCDFNDADTSPSVMPFGLTPAKYILYVSTIEPRKNHGLLFQVWRRMAEEHPDIDVRLVIVGSEGWNVHDIIDIIKANPQLYPSRIAFLDRVDDQTLHWLYANCLFTVYPSFGEGWGLPVVESLGYGKMCITSNNSSLPEASQGCSLALDPLDIVGWYGAVVDHIRDGERLNKTERLITEKFRRTRWADAMDGFTSAIHDIFSRRDNGAKLS